MDTEYTINCGNDVVAGDEIKFTEAVFSGSYKRPKYIGDRTIYAKVLKESYGVEKQQHTFTLQVIHSEGTNPIEAGTIIRRKGRNIYKNGVFRKPWANEEERQEVAEEKHMRGDIAREMKFIRLKEKEEEEKRFFGF